MFYCDPCADKKKWPKGMFKSLGRCEVCSGTHACNDIPSKDLPLPEKKEITNNDDQS